MKLQNRIALVIDLQLKPTGLQQCQGRIPAHRKNPSVHVRIVDATGAAPTTLSSDMALPRSVAQDDKHSCSCCESVVSLCAGWISGPRAAAAPP